MIKKFTTLLLFIAIGVLIQSCNKGFEEIALETKADDLVLKSTKIDLKTRANCNNSIRSITKAEIPEDVTPLVLKDQQELEDLLDKLAATNLQVVDKMVPKLATTRQEGPGSNGHIVYYGSYDIMLTLAWSERGRGDISVHTTNASTWYFSKWEQNTGVASWDGNSRIRYDVTGTIKVYVLVSAELIEISREGATINGFVNI